MKGKWVRAWGKDYQRGCVYRLIAVLVVVPLFAVCILVPMFIANRRGVSDRDFFLITVIPVVLFLLVLFGGGFGFFFWSLRRRAAWLDEIFAPFGLEGRTYVLTGRQYHGQVRGREMDAFFVRGPTFSIYLSTNLYTRVSISDADAVSEKVARAFNKVPLDAGSEALAVFAHDEEWGAQFVDSPEVKAILDDLIFDESPFYIRQVQIEPGYIVLRYYRSREMFKLSIPPEQGRRWVNQLLRLAELAEQREPPQEKLKASELAASIREGDAAKWGWVVVAVVLVLAACLTAASFGLIYLLESGV